MLWKIIEQVKEGEGVTVFKKMVRVGLNEKETSEQGLDGLAKPAVFLGERAVKCTGLGLCWQVCSVLGSREAGGAGSMEEGGGGDETG